MTALEAGALVALLLAATLDFNAVALDAALLVAAFDVVTSAWTLCVCACAAN